jgi:hypothetical protein
MNESIKFKPALLTKIVDGAPLQVICLEILCLMISLFLISLQMVGCCECNGYFQVSEGMYIVMVTIMIQQD